VDVERRRVAEVEKRENDALATFEEGLKATEENATLLKLAVQFAVELLEKGEATEPTLTPRRLKTAVGFLKRAEIGHKMDEDLYLDWIRVLRNHGDDNDDEAENFVAVMERALIKVPSSLRLWSVKLQKAINEAGFVEGGGEVVRRVLETAVDKVNEKDSWTLWETYLDWMTCTGDDAEVIDAAFKRACVTTGREASKLAKEAYVKYAVEKGEDGKLSKLKAAYDWLKLHRPHSKSYYSFVIGQLADADDKRRVFLDAVDELGKTDVDLWLEFEDFETKRGNTDAGSIYKKALRELDPKLLPEFETKHTLTVTGHLKK